MLLVDDLTGLSTRVYKEGEYLSKSIMTYVDNINRLTREDKLRIALTVGLMCL